MANRRPLVLVTGNVQEIATADALLVDNLAIGTVTPLSKLHILGTSADVTWTRFTTSDYVHTSTGSVLWAGPGAASGNTYSRISALTAGGSVWGDLCLQYGGGRVGIGNTAPAYTLDVTGTGRFTGLITGSISGNAATVTTNANLTGPITSVGNATSVASQTGTGSTFMMSASPTTTGTLTGAAANFSGALTGLTVTGSGGRSTFVAVSELYAVGAKYVSSGGIVYFGATDGTATPGFQISNAGGGNLLSGTTGGAISVPGTLSVTGKITTSGNIVTDAFGAGAGKGVFLRSGFETTAQPGITVVDIDASGNPDDIRVNGYGGGGLYANDTQSLKWLVSGITIPGTLGVTGASTFTGNVGVGTAPSEALDVVGNTRMSGANGQALTLKSQTELLTIAATGASTTAFTLPIRSTIVGASFRVTTAIPTAATFDATIDGSSITNGSTVSTAVNTTYGTAKAISNLSAASSVSITPNIDAGTNTGRVRVTIYYYEVTPPTS